MNYEIMVFINQQFFHHTTTAIHRWVKNDVNFFDCDLWLWKMIISMHAPYRNDSLRLKCRFSNECYGYNLIFAGQAILRAKINFDNN